VCSSGRRHRSTTRRDNYPAARLLQKIGALSVDGDDRWQAHEGSQLQNWAVLLRSGACSALIAPSTKNPIND
jgi:hypothetical protein